MANSVTAPLSNRILDVQCVKKKKCRLTETSFQIDHVDYELGVIRA